MPLPNVFTMPIEFDHQEPEGFFTGDVALAPLLGGRELLVNVFEIEAGSHVCPYHYEYVEEWLLVMTGSVKIRTPSGIESAGAGDVVCFPKGPAGAHKVWNDAQESARVIMFSTDTVPSVCVYPDGDKVGVWTENVEDHWMFRGTEGKLDYFDGERASEH